MMHDQADELRQLVRQQACRPTHNGPGAPLVVVGGGKGGVGTTTIAVNLAVALARQGRRAVFVDGDLDHGGNANFGHQHAHASVVDVLKGRCTVHEVLERGPSGIQVVAGSWASGELNDLPATVQERFVAELKDLAPHADVVVVDAGSSRNRLASRFWRSADIALVVTTTESLAIMDAYAAVKAMAGGDESWSVHLVVNQASDAAVAGEIQTRIAAACQRFLGLRAHAAGHLPSCPTDEPSEGVLIFPPRCESARALDRVADTLWAQLQLVTARDATARRSARSA